FGNIHITRSPFSSGGISPAREAAASLSPRVVKIGPANRNVEGRRRNPAHGDSGSSSRLSTEVIASRRSIVSGGHGHGNSLRRRLLPKGIEEAESRGGHSSFTVAKAQAHHVV